MSDVVHGKFVSPPESVQRDAYIPSMAMYDSMYEDSMKSPEQFWHNIAVENFHWDVKPNPEKILDYNFDCEKGPIFIRWFSGARTNLCYNALDKHVLNGLGDRIAFYWEGNDPRDRMIVTYQELLLQVRRLANVLKQWNVNKGVRVAIYMPMIPELVISVLACARIGAVHSVIFAGFSAEAVADRIIDAKCSVLLTCDGVWRGNKLIDVKEIANHAMKICAEHEVSVSRCLVVKHVTSDPFSPSEHSSPLHTAAAVAMNTPQNNHLNVSNGNVESCNFPCGGDNNTKTTTTTTQAASAGVRYTRKTSMMCEQRHVEYTRVKLDEDPTHHVVGCRPAALTQFGMELRMMEGRDFWWHETMMNVSDSAESCPPVWMEAEDPLFMLYTSGSTGKPKGVLHTTGGYMVYAATTFKYTFDYQHDRGDVFWCTADVGWITGHSYVVYGPLCNGATSVLYEGIPTWPDVDRNWEMIDRYRVSQFYTAPTAIRTLLRAGDAPVKRHSRSSLRILGTVGEPINPEVWLWYHKVVGDERCAVVDTFWQTETGGHVITPLPGCTPCKPGSACLPFFSVEPQLLSEKDGSLLPLDKSNVAASAAEGYLVFSRPWPGIMRTVYGDHARFEATYFRKFPGYYCTGDGAKRDQDGYYWITGRIDDMLNVSGHLLSTAEIESALVEHHGVAEAAAVARPHAVKGECTYCFVTLKEGFQFTEELKQELVVKVREKIGAFAAPDFIQEAPGLPKTRSGKIMRRVLRQIAVNSRELGDTSTLADPGVIETLFSLRPANA